MTTLNLPDTLMEQLSKYARSAGISIEQLLKQWVEIPPTPSLTNLIQNIGMSFHELKMQERRLRSLIDSQNTYIIRTDAEGRYTYVNPLFVAQFVPDGQEVLGTSSMSSIHPDDHPKTFDAVMQCILQKGTPIPVTLRKVNMRGELCYTEWEFVAVEDDENVLEIQCVGFDVTKRHLAEQALRASEERYRAVSELISDYAYSMAVTPDGQLVHEWITDSFKNITGFAYQDIDKNGMLALYHPDDQERVAQDLARVLQGQETDSEYRIYTKDNELRWIRLFRRPIIDEQGRIIRFYGVAKDITERKQSEAEHLEKARLTLILEREQAWRESISRMMKVVSHELRNPLTVILTNVNLLDRYHEQLNNLKRQQRLQGIVHQVRLISNIVNEVSDVVRGTFAHGNFQPRTTNLERLCLLSLSDIHNLGNHQHVFNFVSDGTLKRVQVDETLVSRILVNLLSNAVKYSPNGGIVEVLLKRQDDEVLIQVRDEGIGISPENQKHLFEMFYRAENVGSIAGTGLGLNIVKDCVEMHRGRIQVESRVGKGSTFSVYLPYISAD